MYIKSRSIILRTIKYGDKSIIVDAFTEQLGRVSFVVTGITNKKATIKKQLFQPLSLLLLEFDYRPKSDLQKICSAQLYEPFKTIHFNHLKLGITLFLSEFLYYSTRKEQKNEHLFNFLSYSIEWFDNMEHSFSNFHLVLAMHLTRFLGVFPNLEKQEKEMYFDLQEGCFCASPPKHLHYLKPNQTEKIHTLMRLNYTSMHLFKMNKNDRNECIDVIIEYYKLHIPTFPDLQSLHVLRELFD